MDNQISVNVRRAFIETNLEACKKSIAMSLYQIGTLLCQAKDEGIVPHGEWTAWATAHSGLNERGVQYAMRQARELTADSPLLALDDSKINALLRIPAGEREEFAERIDAKGASSREVADAVAQYRRERDEALRLVGEQKKRMAEAERKESNMRDVLDRNVKMLKDTREKFDRERQEHTKHESMLQKKLSDAREQVDGLQQAMLRSESELKELVEEMNAKREQSDTELRRMSDLNERLEKALSKKEEEIDRLTDAVDAARTEAARGVISGGGERSPVTTILSAIGALMAEAGGAPGELARMQGLDEETVRLLRGQAQLLGQWAMQVLAVCGGDGR